MGRREEAGDKEESKETFEEKKMEEQEKLRIFREGSIEDAFPQPCNWLFHSAPCALRCKVQTWLTSSSFHKSGLVWLMSLCDSKTFNSKKNAFHVKEMCLLTFIWAKKYMCARVSVWMKNKVEQRKNERERRNWQRERKEVKKTVIWQNISLLNSCVNINQTSNHKLCKVCRKVTNDHSEGKKNKKTQNLFTYFCKKKNASTQKPTNEMPKHLHCDTHSRTPSRRCRAGAERPWRSVGPPGQAGAAWGTWRCAYRTTCTQSALLYPEKEREDTRKEERSEVRMLHFLLLISKQKCKMCRFSLLDWALISHNQCASEVNEGDLCLCSYKMCPKTKHNSKFQLFFLTYTHTQRRQRRVLHSGAVRMMKWHNKRIKAGDKEVHDKTLI